LRLFSIWSVYQSICRHNPRRTRTSLALRGRRERKRRMFNIQCSGFWGMNKADFGKHPLEMLVHALQFEFIGQPGEGLVRGRAARPKELVANDHDRLGQVQGGKAGRGNRRNGVAIAQMLVGEALGLRGRKGRPPCFLGRSGQALRPDPWGWSGPDGGPRCGRLFPPRS
jgi:hypothetical protein